MSEPLGNTQLGVTQAEKLAEEIASAILAGEYEPGARLDETQLAQKYGTSRTPVREALRQLTTTGLIETRPRRGATVTKVSSQQLQEMFVAMGEVEATCARLAAISMTPIERRRLEALQTAMGEMARKGEVDTYTASNQTFHSLIYAGAHNPILSDFAIALRRRLIPYRQAQFQTEGRLPRSLAEHGAVVAAILSGDADAAHKAMLYHVSLVEDAFEAYSAGSVVNR